MDLVVVQVTLILDNLLELVMLVVFLFRKVILVVMLLDIVLSILEAVVVVPVLLVNPDLLLPQVVMEFLLL